MLRKALLFLVLCGASVLYQAPATQWDNWLQAASAERLSLLEASGSLWHGRGLVSIRDTTTGIRQPITPVTWGWRPLDLFRGQIAWNFSVAGLQPFSLSVSPSGVAASNVSIQLPMHEVMEQIPNALARSGWRGDLNLTADRWHCNWQNNCDGHADLFWRGAAADLFPNRNFGDYRFVLDASGDSTDLKIETLSGEVRLDGKGRFSKNGLNLQGSVEGDPAFVGRMPDVAGRWVRRSGTPGKILVDVKDGAAQ